MSSFAQLSQYLPTLYRPAAEDDVLLVKLLNAVSQHLDSITEEMNKILQAHWYSYADKAEYNNYFNLIESSSTPEQFPYIHDLARLASLIPVLPHLQPLSIREPVEAYRNRIRQYLNIYREGLGTVAALRRIMLAELPQPVSNILSNYYFTIEENALLKGRSESIKIKGYPADILGPLMTWMLTNPHSKTIAPTIYIEGMQPEDNQIAATINPMIEFCYGDSSTARDYLSLVYLDTLAAGTVLRLQPSYRCWLGTATGIQLSTEASSQNSLWPQMTATGPWHAFNEEAAPVSEIILIKQSVDHILWVVSKEENYSRLWQFDGHSWKLVIDVDQNLIINALANFGQQLLLGTNQGLKQLDRYTGEELKIISVAALHNNVVYALLCEDEKTCWVGTDSGVFQLKWENDQAAIITSALLDVATYAIAKDQNDIIYFGGEAGLFQWQPRGQHWYRYIGQYAADQDSDWSLLLSHHLSIDNNFYLPTIKSIFCDSQSTLWLGTEQGVARYRAHATTSAAGTAIYDTYLQAFPELLGSAVTSIQQDERGLLWFCTALGLWQYDSNLLFRYDASGKWLPQGKLDEYVNKENRGRWRYSRSEQVWQRLNDGAENKWDNVQLRNDISAESVSAVFCLLWTDHVIADLGIWQAGKFIAQSRVPEQKLKMRYKPNSTRIVDGGLPAIPRLPQGQSTWRYLSLELEPNNYVLPEQEQTVWTQEGRLITAENNIKQSLPISGRYDNKLSLITSPVYAFLPAAKIWFEQPKPQCMVLIRMQRADEKNIEPAIIDNIWQGLQYVRPAGIRILLAVGQTIVRGEKP
jgi:hypothetical protein